MTIGVKVLRRRWLPGLLGLFVGILAGMLPAREAGADCVDGEVVRLNDPVVVVISGPGNVTDEQARLSELEWAYLEGTGKITMGQTTFEIERNP